jgi:hypothetical protein
MKKALIVSALAGAAAFAMASSANAVPPTGVCPTIGASTDCSVVITIQPGGSILIETTGVGPFDNSEDSLVGVVNNSGGTITSLAISGSNIFGFDGDGLAAFTGGGTYGPTGYEGPNTSFTITDTNNGFVNFLNGGLLDGQTAYFSLEENLAAGGVPITVGSAAPEPATWAMMILGFGMAGVAFRRRKQRQIAIA